MQRKAEAKRYFNQDLAGSSFGKKQKFQKKQNQAESPKGTGLSPNNPKKKFGGPKDKGTKRKPDEIIRENGDAPAKKIKIDPSIKVISLESKKNEKKGQKHESKLSVGVETSQALTTGEVPQNRSGRRRMKTQLRREASKRSFSTVVDNIQKGDADAIEKIKERIASIKSRDTLSNTARRKIKKFENVLKLAGIGVEDDASGKGAGVIKKKSQGKKDQKNIKKQESKQNTKKPLVKKTNKEVKVPSDSDDEEEDNSDYDTEIAMKPKISKKINKKFVELGDEEEESANEEESDNEEEESGEEEEVSGEEEEESGDQEEESGDEEEESGEEEESEDSNKDDSAEMSNSKSEFISLQTEEDESDDEEGGSENAEKEDSEAEDEIPTKQFKNKQNESPQKGKSRYVVFVGNLPYDVEKSQMMEHFKRVGEIKDVRIAKDPKTNKPRGFAYVEVTNEQSYQKALGLHNTFIGGRKINVQYTKADQKGENVSKEIKAKNMKFQAMKKQGKFAGAKNPSQQRAQRRMKQGSK